KADAIILNKVDLIPYLDFDEEFYMKGVRILNKEVPVFKVSGKTGEGFAEVARWIEEKARNAKAITHDHDGHDHSHEHSHDHSDHTHHHDDHKHK
ncbi:MAG: hydrogenase accessory protein HypB, partial [Bacillota bacterium]|nr:hydrogenase accessory protein HypB [Bacillota bacterium]